MPADEIIKTITNLDDDILDIGFNGNGTELWITCKNLHITVIDTSNWHVTKNVSPDGFHIKSISRLSTGLTKDIVRQPLNSLWIGLSNERKFVFLFEKPTESTINVKTFEPWECSGVKHFTQSPDDKMLALIAADGSLKIYSVEFLLRQAFQTLRPSRTAIDQQNLELNHGMKAFDKKVQDFFLLKLS